MPRYAIVAIVEAENGETARNRVIFDRLTDPRASYVSDPFYVPEDAEPDYATHAVEISHAEPAAGRGGCPSDARRTTRLRAGLDYVPHEEHDYETAADLQDEAEKYLGRRVRDRERDREMFVSVIDSKDGHPTIGDGEHWTRVDDVELLHPLYGVAPSPWGFQVLANGQPMSAELLQVRLPMEWAEEVRDYPDSERGTFHARHKAQAAADYLTELDEQGGPPELG